MKKLFDFLSENSENLSENWFSDESKYDLRHKNDILIFVDVNKLLDRHLEDDPNFSILKKENQIGNRVEKAKEFIKNYIHNDRVINPKTGERTKYEIRFEPSIVDIYNNKLSFEDGRHRVLAAKEMGLKEVAIEIRKDKLGLFQELINKNNKESMQQDKSENLRHIKGFKNFKINEDSVDSSRDFIDKGFYLDKPKDMDYVKSSKSDKRYLNTLNTLLQVCTKKIQNWFDKNIGVEKSGLYKFVNKLSKEAFKEYYSLFLDNEDKYTNTLFKIEFQTFENIFTLILVNYKDIETDKVKNKILDLISINNWNLIFLDSKSEIEIFKIPASVMSKEGPDYFNQVYDTVKTKAIEFGLDDKKIVTRQKYGWVIFYSRKKV
jgi:hypothetical protein